MTQWQVMTQSGNDETGTSVMTQWPTMTQSGQPAAEPTLGAAIAGVVPKVSRKAAPNAGTLA